MTFSNHKQVNQPLILGNISTGTTLVIITANIRCDVAGSRCYVATDEDWLAFIHPADVNVNELLFFCQRRFHKDKHTMTHP